MPEPRIGLARLLEETPEAYYWMGLIAADGSLSDRRLHFGLAIKDRDQVELFAKFIGVWVRLENEGSFAVCSRQEPLVVPLIREKFGFQEGPKTYSPLRLGEMTDALFLSFFAGFVDGDGNISFVPNRRNTFLRIKVHSSWLEVLREWEGRIYSIFPRSRETKTNGAKLTSSGYALLQITDNQVLGRLVDSLDDFGIPKLERKWGLIERGWKGRYEEATGNEIAVAQLLSRGRKQTDVAKLLGLSEGGVSLIKSRLAAREKRAYA